MQNIEIRLDSGSKMKCNISAAKKQDHLLVFIAVTQSFQKKILKFSQKNKNNN